MSLRADSRHRQRPRASACRAPPAAPSCSRPRRPPSSSPATTRPPWTTSPSAPASPSRCSTSTSPASSSSTSPCSTSTARPSSSSCARPSPRPTDNKERVYATIAAYFDFVSRDGAAFRLIFESDLTNESAVRNRLDAVGLVCAEAVAEVIAEDTGLHRARTPRCSAWPSPGWPRSAPATGSPRAPTSPRTRPPASSAPSPGGASARSPRWAGKVPDARLVSLEDSPGTRRYAACHRIRRKATHRGGQDRRPERRARGHHSRPNRARSRCRQGGDRGVEKDGLLTLTDDKGRQIIVPADVLGYVQIGESEQARRRLRRLTVCTGPGSCA